MFDRRLTKAVDADGAVVATFMNTYNLFPIILKGKMGYIDHTGEIAIEPRYDLACIFSNGLARVKTESLWGYIDWIGKYVIDLQNFDFVFDFAEELAAVKLNNLWGYINQSGQMLIPPQFDLAKDFSEGLAAVQVRGKYGYINNTGQFAIAPEFKEVSNFLEGLARVNADKLLFRHNLLWHMTLLRIWHL